MLVNFIKSWDKFFDVLVFILFGDLIFFMIELKYFMDMEYDKVLFGGSIVVVVRFIEFMNYLVCILEWMEKFYDSIGGIIG